MSCPLSSTMLGRARSLLQLAASWRTISPTCAHSGPAERRAVSSPPFASAVAISRAASRVAASHSATSTASEGSFAWKRRAWQSSCTAIAATRWPPYAACRLAYAHWLRASRRASSRPSNMSVASGVHHSGACSAVRRSTSITMPSGAAASAAYRPVVTACAVSTVRMTSVDRTVGGSAGAP